MRDSKEWKHDWHPLVEGMALHTAIRDVMDNLGAAGEPKDYREFIRQNLLALVNVTRQQTATELYQRQARDAQDEIPHYRPHTIKETMREQAEAVKAFYPTSQGNSTSSGTDTTAQGDEPF